MSHYYQLQSMRDCKGLCAGEFHSQMFSLRWPPRDHMRAQTTLLPRPATWPQPGQAQGNSPAMWSLGSPFRENICARTVWART